MNGNSPASLAGSSLLLLRRPGFARANHASFNGLLAIVVRQACHELRLRCYRRVRFRSRAQDEVRHAYQAMEVWEFEGLWKGERWGTALKYTFDALVYALLTAGVFGWLWP